MKVLNTGVEFTVAGQTHTMSFDGMTINLGGASDRLVFFTHPLMSEWTLYTSDRNVLNNPTLKQHTHLQGHLSKARNKRRLNHSILIAVVVLILAAPLLFFTQMGSISHVIARQIPPEWEQQLGESVHAQYQLQNESMDEESLEPLLEPLVSPLKNALVDVPYDFHFFIVNNGQLNAFALPGGYVVIHSGLILAADSAEELLGVVAHEIAHVTEQHGLRNMISAAGVYVVIGALLGDINGIMGTIAGAAPLLINQGYSRNFEREADSIGHDLLIKANINPEGLTDFFEKILAQEEKQREAMKESETPEILQDSLKFLSSHPATEERIERLRNISDHSQQNFLNLEQEFLALQAAVKDFVTQPNEADHANGN